MDTLAFNQALLQHYGWRSFYVDCSACASVAAWFASHTFSQKNVIKLCEDCDELAIMMIKIRADYMAKGTCMYWIKMLPKNLV